MRKILSWIGLLTSVALRFTHVFDSLILVSAGIMYTIKYFGFNVALWGSVREFAAGLDRFWTLCLNDILPW